MAYQVSNKENSAKANRPVENTLKGVVLIMYQRRGDDGGRTMLAE